MLLFPLVHHLIVRDANATCPVVAQKRLFYVLSCSTTLHTTVRDKTVQVFSTFEKVGL
jgi:hypothetical protein